MEKPRHFDNRKPKKAKAEPALRGSKKGKSAPPHSTSIAPENSDNPKILKMVEARKRHQKEKRAHRKFVWNMIADACTFARELMEDEEAWLAFCALHWRKLKGPKPNQRDQAARFTIKFLSARGKKGEKKSSFYYNAVKDLLADGIEGKELVQAIKAAGGLTKLRRRRPDEGQASGHGDDPSGKPRPNSGTSDASYREPEPYNLIDLFQESDLAGAPGDGDAPTEDDDDPLSDDEPDEVVEEDEDHGERVATHRETGRRGRGPVPKPTDVQFTFPSMPMALLRWKSPRGRVVMDVEFVKSGHEVELRVEGFTMRPSKG